VKKYKVYIAKLKRIDAEPYTVMKVGITGFQDALKRLEYCKEDEQYPITKYFPEVKVMKSRWVSSKDVALKLEKKIMDNIKKQNEKFHNWREPEPMSGITECRKWDYDEFLKMCDIMDKFTENC
jgi:hypothetical protein